METSVNFTIQKQKAVLSKLGPDLQHFCKNTRGFFDLLESDNYSLRTLVASFIEKIRVIFRVNNPVEVVEEFEKWMKFFLEEKKKLLEIINNKIAKEILDHKPFMKSKKIYQSWMNEISVMSSKQRLTEALESEALNMTKVDHPAYFRRRFLKSKIILEEVNQLRSEESSNKNHIEIEKRYGKELLDK